MKTTKRKTAQLAAAAAWLFAALGCNAVLGLEERTLAEPDVCEYYCATVMAACTGSDAQYENDGVCLAACYEMNTGDPGDTSGNTAECRVSFAEEAQDLRDDGQDVRDVCNQAGYGSAIFDDPVDDACVSPCQFYCARLPEICAVEFQNAGLDDENCGTTCSGFPIDPDFDAIGPDRDTFDTLQCRLWHLANAEENPGTHCGHAVGIGKCAQPFD